MGDPDYCKWDRPIALSGAYIDKWRERRVLCFQSSLGTYYSLRRPSNESNPSQPHPVPFLPRDSGAFYSSIFHSSISTAMSEQIPVFLYLSGSHPQKSSGVDFSHFSRFSRFHPVFNPFLRAPHLNDQPCASFNAFSLASFPSSPLFYQYTSPLHSQSPQPPHSGRPISPHYSLANNARISPEVCFQYLSSN